MHSEPMRESAGVFRDDWQPAIKDGQPWPCPKCRVAGQVTFKVWDSNCGGYEDIKYRCEACGKTWWVESSDS
jgi:RecJ-like exonuclease